MRIRNMFFVFKTQKEYVSCSFSSGHAPYVSCTLFVFIFRSVSFLFGGAAPRQSDEDESSLILELELLSDSELLDSTTGCFATFGFFGHGASSSQESSRPDGNNSSFRRSSSSNDGNSLPAIISNALKCARLDVHALAKPLINHVFN